MEEARGERKPTENNTGKGTILSDREDARPSEGKANKCNKGRGSAPGFLGGDVLSSSPDPAGAAAGLGQAGTAGGRPPARHA